MSHLHEPDPIIDRGDLQTHRKIPLYSEIEALEENKASYSGHSRHFIWTLGICLGHHISTFANMVELRFEKKST